MLAVSESIETELQAQKSKNSTKLKHKYSLLVRPDKIKSIAKLICLSIVNDKDLQAGL